MRAPGWRWSRLAWPAGFAISAVALFLLYLFQSSRTTTVNSDGASNALQGWAMLHGNVLLHGWTVSDVSFYTTELPQYVLVEAIRGLSPNVVHICGAMTYTLLVLLAAWLAMGREAPGRTKLAAGAVTAGIMLAPQLGNPTDMLLLSPDHVGTGVPLLVAWLLVDRTRQPDREKEPGWRRWLVPVAVGLILAWTAVGDQLAEVIGALPLALTCGLRVLWARFRPSGTGQRAPLRDSWYELSLGTAAVLSVPAAWLGVKLISALGGWSITAPRSGLAAPGVLGRNAALTGSGILQLFGAGFSSQQSAAQTAFAVIHLTGLALAAWALCLAMRRFFAQQLLVQLLGVAIVVNIAAYIVTVQAESIATTREIAAVLPFGAVLAGRLLPQTLAARRPAHATGRLSPVWVAAGGLLLASYAVMLGYNASRPPAPGQVANLASWLAAHHLTRGLGGYWQSNSVTLDSNDTVQVRAIAINEGKLTTAPYWEASSAWYDAQNSYANFIVNAPPAWHPHAPGVLVNQMEAIAGKPAKIYHIRGYTIAVWRQNLLSRLG
jgi:hypothetical protein